MRQRVGPLRDPPALRKGGRFDERVIHDYA